MKSHVVLAVEYGPHRLGVALKRSDSEPVELLHHHRRSHAKVFEPPQPELDGGKARIGEPPVAPTGVRNGGP